MPTPPDRSLSAHVRPVLPKDLERQRARDAAAAFRTFVDVHPDEQVWLAEWDGIDLTTPPTRD